METHKEQVDFVERVRPGANGWVVLFVLVALLLGMAFPIIFAPPIV